MAAILDLKQLLDKVWYSGILYKLKSALLGTYYLLLKSYNTERHIQIKHNNIYWKNSLVRAGVLQGSVLGPLLCLIYTSDVSITISIMI